MKLDPIYQMFQMVQEDLTMCYRSQHSNLLLTKQITAPVG